MIRSAGPQPASGTGGIALPTGTRFPAAVALVLTAPCAARSDERTAAILAGDVGAVRVLRAAGADVDAAGDLGTPLHVAARQGDVAQHARATSR